MLRRTLTYMAAAAAALTLLPNARAESGPSRTVDLVSGRASEVLDITFFLEPHAIVNGEIQLMSAADCEVELSIIARDPSGDLPPVVETVHLFPGEGTSKGFGFITFDEGDTGYVVLETSMLHQTGPCNLLAYGRLTDHDGGETFAHYKPQFYLGALAETNPLQYELRNTYVTSYSLGGAGNEEAMAFGFKLDPIVIANGERRKTPRAECRASFTVETRDVMGENESLIEEIDLAGGDFAQVVVPATAFHEELLLVSSKVKDVVRTGPCRLLAVSRIYEMATGETRVALRGFGTFQVRR